MSLGIGFVLGFFFWGGGVCGGGGGGGVDGNILTLNFLVAVVNTLNIQTHSCKEMAEYCFEIKSISIVNRGR